MNYSTTQATNIAAFAGLVVIIARYFKLELDGAEVEMLIGAIASAVAIIINFINRYKKGDVTLGGFKK